MGGYTYIFGHPARWENFGGCLYEADEPDKGWPHPQLDELMIYSRGPSVFSLFRFMGIQYTISSYKGKN